MDSETKREQSIKDVDPFSTPDEEVYDIGDKVYFKPAQKDELGSRYTDKEGEVVDHQINGSGQRFYRVLFGPSPFDYQDVISYRLKRAN
jgi:hypothetical protein